MEKLILIGAGGYAKSVLDSVDGFNYQVIGFIDEFATQTEHLGLPILSNSLTNLPRAEKYVYFISIGNNRNRKVWYDRLTEQKLRLINVVDRSAIVSSRALLGGGCFVGKMAMVNSNAVIGSDCIINSRALIEHGCHISDHVNVSTNAVLNGDVTVGRGSFVGSSSVTIGQRHIGEWSTVGAGAVVIHDVGDNITVAGVPAKMINKGAKLG